MHLSRCTEPNGNTIVPSNPPPNLPGNHLDLGGSTRCWQRICPTDGVKIINDTAGFAGLIPYIQSILANDAESPRRWNAVPVKDQTKTFPDLGAR